MGAWENYFIDGSDVLKNKFNITDNKELEEKEKEITFKKMVELELAPIDGNFDMNHLKNIHKYLFSDIYYFAGEFRCCTMAKTTRNFYDPDMIEDELNRTLIELNKESKNIMSKRWYAQVLAKAYYDLMTIHPFREGNGRSVREFLREFVLAKNDELNLEVKLDYDEMDNNLFLQAVEYRYVYPSLLDEEFYKAIVPLEKTHKM